MSGRISVGLFFGGESPEHEVSVRSALEIYAAFDKRRFDVLPIGIDKEGGWHLFQRNATTFTGELEQGAMPKIDVAFPIIHGATGEDGVLQGFFEAMRIPVVGPSVASAALCMDKDATKRILQSNGIAVAPYQTVRRGESLTPIPLPAFVKPARAGSSFGLAKVTSDKELARAVECAFAYDSKVLIERAVEGLELEIAVLGNESPRASLPGRVIPKDGYYSFGNKMDLEGAHFELPAQLPQEVIQSLQSRALAIYTALDCVGMARVDLFLTPGGEIVCNEVNTIPGFTRGSLYPKLWAISGLDYGDLLTELVRLSVSRMARATGRGAPRYGKACMAMAGL